MGGGLLTKKQTRFFTEGLTFGLLLGIRFKTGQDVSEGGVMLTVANALCSVIPCNWLWAVTFLVFVAGIADVVTNLQDGGIIWLLGAVLGVGMLFLG